MSKFALGQGESVDVYAVNRSIGLVVLSTGETAPVVGWIDCLGEDCSPDDAVVCVAGPISGRNTLSFVTVDLREFCPAVVN